MPIGLMSGDELFYNTCNEKTVTIKDFWSWCMSDFSGNTIRGVLAEFIVANALGIQLCSAREEWAAYDLKYDDAGIEVKCSSFWQSWQYGKSPTLQYDISESHFFDPLIGYTNEIRRASSVYVFCLFGKEDKEKKCNNEEMPDVMDMNNWSFFVASTEQINDVYKKQKKATLNSLKKNLKISALKYSQIKDAVDAILQRPIVT